MAWQDHIIDARRLWLGDAGDWGPLALVDLGRAAVAPGPLVLPPCPVIGFGDPAHPLAARLDAVVEAPVTLATLARQIVARPCAAAVVVDLLRLICELDDQAALVAESFAFGLLQGSGEHGEWLAAKHDLARAPSGNLLIERQEQLLRLTLDRPAAGNAIDRGMRDQLVEAFAMAAIDPTILRIVLQARGRSFCLGADLAEFGTTRDPATAHAIRRRTLPARQITRCADRLAVRVQGACVGAGLEMAAWAHRLVATPRSWFQLPELAMGILPGAGGCVALTRRIGRQRTALMILSGKRISAPTALAWGLIDAMVDDLASDDGGADIGG